ncbi:hypothetical protein [uncultured Brevundimonas sp.]|uniref:hypothetical protein n=1 Tax=uncultured Brevundimonas sp. TaxID=213418 RepID=UPI0026322623|nr:hypothetical protein [uncultured Brevundimonas sp.]
MAMPFRIAPVASGFAALACVFALSACDRTPPQMKGPSPEEQAAAPAWEKEDVWLYMPDHIIKQRIDEKALTPYMDQVTAAAEAALKAAPREAGSSNMLLVMIKPGQRAKSWIVSSKPELSPEKVEGVTAAVNAIAAPAVNGGPVLVGVRFKAYGGGEPLISERPPIPKDWYQYFGDKGLLDDAFMARVWPD